MTTWGELGDTRCSRQVCLYYLRVACGALSAKLAHVEDLGSGPGAVILLLKRESARSVETDRGQMMSLVRREDEDMKRASMVAIT